MRKHDSTNWEIVVMGTVALLSLGYAIGTHTKLSKISERFERGVYRLSGEPQRMRMDT